MNGKYTIELCRPGGEDTGIERVFERQDDLAIARKLYRTIATEYPGRVVMLCDAATGEHCREAQSSIPEGDLPRRRPDYDKQAS
jgi:hypothetical protein